MKVFAEVRPVVHPDRTTHALPVHHIQSHTSRTPLLIFLSPYLVLVVLESLQQKEVQDVDHVQEQAEQFFHCVPAAIWLYALCTLYYDDVCAHLLTLDSQEFASRQTHPDFRSRELSFP